MMNHLRRGSSRLWYRTSVLWWRWGLHKTRTIHSRQAHPNGSPSVTARGNARATASGNSRTTAAR